MHMAIVFQYGSNAWPDRLNSPDRLRGDAEPVGLARTSAHHELHFEVDSQTNRCAAANIRNGGTRSVWGVLYEIPDALLSRQTAGARRSLDAIEGEGTNYRRVEIEVVKRGPTDTPQRVWTYLALAPVSGLRTSFDYVSYIIRGLRKFAAPGSYVAYVKDMAVKNNGDFKDLLEPL